MLKISYICSLFWFVSSHFNANHS